MRQAHYRDYKSTFAHLCIRYGFRIGAGADEA